MSTILITGGAGFIGTNLCIRLLKEGNKVICVDNLYTGQMRNIEPLMSNPNFKFINHNIIEPLKKKERRTKNKRRKRKRKRKNKKGKRR